jgi:hypothetical protein
MSFALIGAARKIHFSQQEKQGYHAQAENDITLRLRRRHLLEMFLVGITGAIICLYHQLYREN